FVIFILLNYLFPPETRREVRSLRNRRLSRVSPGLPLFGFARPGPRQRGARSAHLPTSSRGALKRPNHLHWSSEKSSAVLLKRNLAFSDSLLHDHRTDAAIHLRNCFPSRQCVERLAALERLNQG